MNVRASQPEPEPLAVRVETALRMLGLGRTKFYELVSEGEIQTFKVGRSTLVVVESLHKFVADRQRP